MPTLTSEMSIAQMATNEFHQTLQTLSLGGARRLSAYSMLHGSLGDTLWLITLLDSL